MKYKYVIYFNNKIWYNLIETTNSNMDFETFNANIAEWCEKFNAITPNSMTEQKLKESFNIDHPEDWNRTLEASLQLTLEQLKNMKKALEKFDK